MPSPPPPGPSTGTPPVAKGKGTWKPPAMNPNPPRTARLVEVRHLRPGDEIRFSTKGNLTHVTNVQRVDEERLNVATDTMGERILHREIQVLRLDPKPATKTDQRRPR